MKTRVPTRHHSTMDTRSCPQILTTPVEGSTGPALSRYRCRSSLVRGPSAAERVAGPVSRVGTSLAKSEERLLIGSSSTTLTVTTGSCPDQSTLATAATRCVLRGKPVPGRRSVSSHYLFCMNLALSFHSLIDNRCLLCSSIPVFNRVSFI